MVGGGAKLVPALPAPERIIYRPATVDALPQLFSNNEIDIGRALQVGNFEASRRPQSQIQSWNTSGPVWGAADGCTFRARLQQPEGAIGPWPRCAGPSTLRRPRPDRRPRLRGLDAQGRRAVRVLRWGEGLYRQLKDIIEAAAIDKPDPKRTDELLKSKGFTKGADGKWALPGGAAWPVTILTQQGDPIGPVLAKQLQAAGFDAVFRATQDAAYFDALDTGNFECRSACIAAASTIPGRHSSISTASMPPRPAQKGANARAPHALLQSGAECAAGQDGGAPAFAKDAEYMALVKAATAIILRDVPQVTLTEEIHALTFNTTYWTGYPSAQDPYVAPYLPGKASPSSSAG